LKPQSAVAVAAVILPTLSPSVIYPDKGTKVNGPGRDGGKVRAFEKTVDRVTLKVVAEIKGSECWLMTAYELG
jgi:hypothetical protein